MIPFFERVVDFYRDREYYRLLVKFALPIALQSLITSSLNMVGVIMIGQLGDTSVASIGLANQIWFLLNLLLFGIGSGCAMFVAQLWGKKDIPNVRRVLGLAIKLGLIASLVFWTLATFFPVAVLRLYTEDTAVIELGSQYLRIFGWSYGFYAISTAYSVSLRSTGYVRLPLVVSTAALGLNIMVAYPFIFGWEAIGLSALGVNGAAIAGLIARVLECLALLGVVYWDRLNPSAASLRNLLELDFKFLVSVLKPVLPVIANEFLWSMGITTYSAIYAHIGTAAIAAINIVSTIEQLAFVIFLGIGSATAILVGNLIGQGDKEKAYRYAGRSLGLQITGAALMGLLVYFFAGNLLQFFKVSPEVIVDARNILTVLALGMSVRSANSVIIIGILRSGGDTRFSLVLDGIIIWLVGVPATAAGAFLFHLPIYLVYALTLTEEVTKFVLGLARYFSRKWINDLTQKVAHDS
ncbi:MAG: MATE family efflux transporter [Chloroflexi bacterium]|nr:MATE family efflux transporter [Chloroflexota bacterium]